MFCSCNTANPLSVWISSYMTNYVPHISDFIALSTSIEQPQGWKPLFSSSGSMKIVYSFYRITVTPAPCQTLMQTPSPRMQVQQSSLVLCFCSSSWVTSIKRPLSPVRSFPLLAKRIQSMRLWPGFKATYNTRLEKSSVMKQRRGCLLKSKVSGLKPQCDCV